MHIALVEESGFHANLFAQSLADQHPDYQITSYVSAREFLTKLADNRFDLAVIDQALPDMDSPELIKRTHAQYPELPIIVFSDIESERAVEQINEGVRAYLAHRRDKAGLVPNTIGPAGHGKRITLRRTQSEDVGAAKEPANLAEIMAATLQHEINNPLMAILGNVELLLSDPACQNDDLAERLRIIESSARRIQESTQHLANLICPVVRQTAAGPMLQLEKAPGRTRRGRSQTVLSNKSI
jgi:DNA-binding NarL/FixJ family response regulator